MIIIIDHGQGNIGSLSNALKYLNIDHKVCSNKDEASKIKIDGFILPGVGTFNAGMEKMKERSLDTVVLDLIDKNVKGLGICLGMQMLCEGSEEGDFKEPGLGIVNGYIRKLETKNDFVPNVGWIQTSELENKMKKKKGFSLNGTYYYVHSYALNPEECSDVIAQCKHGGQSITSAIYKRSVLGVQFHPEKSQGMGLKLINDYFNN